MLAFRIHSGLVGCSSQSTASFMKGFHPCPPPTVVQFRSDLVGLLSRRFSTSIPTLPLLPPHSLYPLTSPLSFSVRRGTGIRVDLVSIAPVVPASAMTTAASSLSLDFRKRQKRWCLPDTRPKYRMASTCGRIFSLQDRNRTTARIRPTKQDEHERKEEKGSVPQPTNAVPRQTPSAAFDASSFARRLDRLEAYIFGTEVQVAELVEEYRIRKRRLAFLEVWEFLRVYHDKTGGLSPQDAACFEAGLILRLGGLPYLIMKPNELSAAVGDALKHVDAEFDRFYGKDGVAVIKDEDSGEEYKIAKDDLKLMIVIAVHTAKMDKTQLRIQQGGEEKVDTFWNLGYGAWIQFRNELNASLDPDDQA